MVGEGGRHSLSPSSGVLADDVPLKFLTLPFVREGLASGDVDAFAE